MATTFELVASSRFQDRGRVFSILEDCHEKIDELERELSRFIKDSAVSKFNLAAPFQKLTVPRSLLEILELAERISDKTANAFSILYQYPELRTRNLETLIEWDFKTNQLWKTEPLSIDLGAIGKGFALDQVRVILERHEVFDYFLSAGGSSMIMSGFADYQMAWEWGWSWKKQTKQAFEGIPFQNQLGESLAIGVSGKEEKGEHIASNACTISAMVLSQSAAVSDALSTALFVSGEKLSESALEVELETPKAVFVNSDERLVMGKSFLKWVNDTKQKWFLSLFFLVFQFHAHADEVVDLSSLNQTADSFNPYLFDRNDAWIFAPLLMIGFVLIHLIPNKPVKGKELK